MNQTSSPSQLALPPLPEELEPLRDSIEHALAPCVFLSPHGGSEESGRTRLGGSPLLDPRAEWPRSDRGPLSFIGQLDFRELAAAGGTVCGLPSDGVLALFYDVEEQPWGYDPSHASGFALSYTRDTSRATELELPDGAIPFDSEPLRASPGWSLPSAHDLLLSSWAEERGWERTYADYQTSVALAQDGGIPGLRQQVGGYAEWLKADGRMTAELASSGVHAGGDPRTWRVADFRRTRNEASNWRLLWQLKPEDERFTWVDLGTLYVVIRDADLAARRFERAWVLFQST